MIEEPGKIGTFEGVREVRGGFVDADGQTASRAVGAIQRWCRGC
jgi:hypothetical protein